MNKNCCWLVAASMNMMMVWIEQTYRTVTENWVLCVLVHGSNVNRANRRLTNFHAPVDVGNGHFSHPNSGTNKLPETQFTLKKFVSVADEKNNK